MWHKRYILSENQHSALLVFLDNINSLNQNNLKNEFSKLKMRIYLGVIGELFCIHIIVILIMIYCFNIYKSWSPLNILSIIQVYDKLTWYVRCTCIIKHEQLLLPNKNNNLRNARLFLSHIIYFF